MEDTVIIINTDNIAIPETKDSLYEIRSNLVASLSQGENVMATVGVQAYNRLDKTKTCIESILAYTTDIPYKLLLIDNGSTDETLAYFKSVEHPHKTILQITKNIGGPYATQFILPEVEGKYYCHINNDLVVTKNWLANLITCAESDPRIGMVTPVSSNVSNLQQVNLTFENPQEMQEKAAAFNVSDPCKWQERMRILTVGTLYTRECLFSIGSIFDIGFVHDFGDDDVSFRARRNGYKTILAGDTWIHHNHNSQVMEDKDPVAFSNSLSSGRQNFIDKYYGIDAWGDVNNFETTLISMLRPIETDEVPMVLGMDVKCGTPLLEIKNRLRSWGRFDTVLAAFTQNAKYLLDLKTICEASVACDREEFIDCYFAPAQFDCILLGEPLNAYREPCKVLQDMIRLLKPGGQILLKLRNTASYRTLMQILGEDSMIDTDFVRNIPLPVARSWIQECGLGVERVQGQTDITDAKLLEQFGQLMGRLADPCDQVELYNRLVANDFAISAIHN